MGELGTEAEVRFVSGTTSGCGRRDDRIGPPGFDENELARFGVFDECRSNDGISSMDRSGWTDGLFRTNDA